MNDAENANLKYPYACAFCGARYYSDKAAVRCCSDSALTQGGEA